MSAKKSTKTAQPSKPKKADATPRLIAENRKARFDFYIEDQVEAGLALQGWEVKSLRAGVSTNTGEIGRAPCRERGSKYV